MRYLRTNTATRVTVGPFLDKTDGITPEVALTVTSEKLTFVVDTAGVPTLILDTAPTASGGANDMVHITGDDSGYYDLELAAADVNYLGRAMLSLNDVATHLPVFHEFMILPAVIYDAMILGTDLFDVSVTQLLGTAWLAPAVAGTPDVNVKTETDHDLTTTQKTSVTAAVPTVAQIADGVWDEVKSGHVGATTFGDLATDLDTGVADVAAVHVHAQAIIDDVALVHTHANTIDGHITADYTATEKTCIDLLDDAAGGLADIHTDVGTAITNIGDVHATDLPAAKTVVDAIKVQTDKLAFTVANQIDANVIDWKSAAAPAMTGDAYAEAVLVHAHVADCATATVLGNVHTDVDNILADTNELQVDDYPTSIAAIKAETALIVADTNELQVDDYPTSIAAIKAETALIVADTGELQTDWANGGRLDLILDTAAGDAHLSADSISDVWAHVGTISSLAVELLLERLYEMVNNKMIVTEATGAVALRNIADSANVATGVVADLGATTQRDGLTWV